MMDFSWNDVKSFFQEPNQFYFQLDVLLNMCVVIFSFKIEIKLDLFNKPRMSKFQYFIIKS